MSRTPKPSELPNRIQEHRLAQGMSLEDVAEAVGSTSSTISKLERGRLRLTSEWMFRLAPVLRVAPRELLPQEAEQIEPERIIALDRASALPEPTVAPADVEIPAPSNFVRDLPVLGTAGGAVIQQVDGFRMEHEVVDYVRRPPALAKQMSAYAIFVVGDSMAPEHNPGDLRFVDPEQRPAIGDTVVVQTKHYADDPGQGYIKKLKRRTPTRIVLQQHNPPAILEIPTDYVVSVHKVLTVNELFGL